ADYAGGNYLFPMTQSYGVQLAYDTASLVSFDNVQDYRNWILRLERYGEYVDQNIALLAKGIERGFTQPAVVTKLLIEQIEAQRVADPARSDYYAPFEDMPKIIPAATQDRKSTRLNSSH